ncbi:MAG: M1 family peptidase [Sphingobacteriales bacterium]|nr:MAG: M1 family peptidase [Sphingobacteriales bacterium]
MTKKHICYAAFLLVGLLAGACEPKTNKQKTRPMQETVTDVHSFARPNEAVVTELDLHMKVDFDTKTLTGKASYKIENKTATDRIFLDTRDLDIQKVTLDADEKETPFAMGEEKEFLGSPLQIHIKPATKYIHIYYKTSPEAAAVQWLDARQTAGGKHPFLFTQSQAILARTWVPCQDGPGVRFTYSATVEVPKDLMAVMSAENPQEKSEDGIYEFEMDKPIPSYLLALAVGNFEFKSLSKRTGVYAEPETLEKAAYEFADMDKMLVTAEELYGPYQWGRYDVLVLPPSFPFGGMENPMLTFATPTILAGDRSLVSLVAHELAHSWSGNLVTNANWNDFWLNEGFTVYFERRIMEAIEGKDYADMLEVLGYQDLQKTLEDLGPNSNHTKLKLDLKDRDPDDGMNQIAYEKGYFLLRTIEEKVGRKRFDKFVKEYFHKFSFQSMTTEAFVEYIDKELVANHSELRPVIQRWIYEPNIPNDVKVADSKLFHEVEEELESWKNGKDASKLHTKNWSSHEWLHFIRHFPADMDMAKMQELDKAFNFSNSGNSEILAAWFEHVISHKYEAAYPQMASFMKSVGRRKFIVPLYKLLVKSEEGKKMAMDIYKEARPNYHAVAVNTLDELLGWQNL